MSMISFVFYALLAIIIITLLLINKFGRSNDKIISISNTIILLASYIFVLYVDYRFLLILIFLTISTWLFAKNVKYYYYGILVVILCLAFFKYTNFFIESFSHIFGYNFNMLNIILPLGISFYTFSAISYLVDVKRGKIKYRNLKDVALYLAYFPKITSGPIQRSDDFFKQIDKKRNINWENFSCGIQIYVFGLFKKIVIADRLSVFVNQVYETPLAFSSFTVFLAAISYSLQIYFDFSGYSDMAIGVSKMLDINLPHNFNLPYLAHNVTELWKRWHITLSTWLQDYLYISLGGNRKGKVRTYLNLIITMIIGGIWHGANWTYIIWGMLHGIALAIHKLWMSITKSSSKSHSLISNLLSIFITFLFTTFCWIFFRAESLSKSITIIKQIFSFKPGINQPYIWLFITLIILGISTLSSLKKSKSNKTKINKYNISYVNGYYPIVNLNSFNGLVIFFIICGLVLCFAYTGGSPFIYGNY